MTARKTSRSTAFGFVAGSALVVALLAGCASSNNTDRVASAADKAQGGSVRQADRNVLQAEKSVVKHPGDATLRFGLGQAYLRAGRFESATSAFNDALDLGDENPRTALSLALANIAIGRNDEAVAILGDWADQLEPADLGLAYSLAGETRRGAAVLADAVRAGAPTVKARQNFAYALALDGRWREARVVLSQDLAPELINDRIGEWATLSQGNSRVRVAALLGTAVRADAGQPQHLALVIPSAAVPAEALTAGIAAPLAELAEASPAAQTPTSLLADAPVESEVPFASSPVAATPQMAYAVTQPGFVSTPVVRSSAAEVARARKPAPSKSSATGTHVVQLGSFASEEGARSARAVYTARTSGLRNYRMTIVPASVNGKSYYRLVASGFDAGTASSMCGSIKSRGGACLAYASTLPISGVRAGTLMARRR